VNKFYLLRHGHTTHHLKHKGIIYPYPEKIPIVLSAKGKRQIESVVKRLKHIQYIYSSDLNRTKQTADIVGKHIRVKPSFHKELREIRQGIFKAGPVKAYHAYFSSIKDKYVKAPPKGESFKQCEERMYDFFIKLDKKHKNSNILIISHGGPLRMLEGAVKKWSIDKLMDPKLMMRMGELRKL